MWSLNVRAGAAANGTTTASSIWNFSLGMRLLAHHGRLLPQLGKKAPNLLPYFGSAGEPSPVRPDQSDKLVAFVHGRDEILGFGGPASMADPVHQERLDIGFHLAQRGVFLCDITPGFHGKHRFHCASRAGIECYDPVLDAREEEKRHIDGDHQTIPL